MRLERRWRPLRTDLTVHLARPRNMVPLHGVVPDPDLVISSRVGTQEETMQIRPFGIAAMALAVSVLASPLAQAKSYLVKVGLQCSVNPNGPPYSVLALNLIPPNVAFPNNCLPQVSKIYWKACNHTSILVFPY